MRNFLSFLKAVGHQWVLLLTGGVMIAAAFVAQAFTALPTWVFMTIAVVTLFSAFYYAWQDQQKMVAGRDERIKELESQLDERAKRRALIDTLSQELRKGRKMLEEAETYDIELKTLVGVADWWFACVCEILEKQLSLADKIYFETDDRHRRDVDESRLPLEPQRQEICRGAQVRILNLNDIVTRLQDKG